MNSLGLAMTNLVLWGSQIYSFMTHARLCKIVYLKLTIYNAENNNVVNQK